MYATPWAGMSRNGEIMRWTLPAEIPKKMQNPITERVLWFGYRLFWSSIFDFDFRVY